jgi:hypothetical protein
MILFFTSNGSKARSKQNFAVSYSFFIVRPYHMRRNIAIGWLAVVMFTSLQRIYRHYFIVMNNRGTNLGLFYCPESTSSGILLTKTTVFPMLLQVIFAPHAK